MLRRISFWPVLMLCMAACGGGSDDGGGGLPAGGGGGGAFAIDPPAVDLERGEVAALTSLSDTTPVSSSWTNSDPSVVSMSATSGTSITITALDAGSATIEANFNGAIAVSVVTVTRCSNPTDPGPVYGTDQNLNAYPPIGGGAPTAVMPLGGWSRGTSIDSTGNFVFVLSNLNILRYDAGAGTGGVAITLPPDQTGYLGLDRDSQDRLITAGYLSGNVRRIDLVAGTTEVLGTASSTVHLAVGPNDNVYTSGLATGPGGIMVMKFDPVTQANTIYSMVPSAITGVNGFVAPAGVAVNAFGEMFLAETGHRRIYKMVDVNMDGDVTDPGEELFFARIPPINPNAINIYGLSAAACDSIIVNRAAGSTERGIYWFHDDNADGDALDTDERVYYNPNEMFAQLDSGCVVAPRP